MAEPRAGGDGGARAAKAPPPEAAAPPADGGLDPSLLAQLRALQEWASKGGTLEGWSATDSASAAEDGALPRNAERGAPAEAPILAGEGAASDARHPNPAPGAVRDRRSRELSPDAQGERPRARPIIRRHQGQPLAAPPADRPAAGPPAPWSPSAGTPADLPRFAAPREPARRGPARTWREQISFWARRDHRRLLAAGIPLALLALAAALLQAPSRAGLHQPAGPGGSAAARPSAVAEGGTSAPARLAPERRQRGQPTLRELAAGGEDASRDTPLAAAAPPGSSPAASSAAPPGGRPGPSPAPALAPLPEASHPSAAPVEPLPEAAEPSVAPAESPRPEVSAAESSSPQEPPPPAWQVPPPPQSPAPEQAQQRPPAHPQRPPAPPPATPLPADTPTEGPPPPAMRGSAAGGTATGAEAPFSSGEP